MDRQDRHLYKFDSFLLDVNERLLLKDGDAATLAPKALGDQARKPRFIKTVPKVGYRFIAPVQAGPEGSNGAQAEAHSSKGVEGPTGLAREDDEPGMPAGQPRRWRLESVFAGHLWHAVTGCALYALLYSVALVLEVAYEFGHYGARALQLVPGVFVWILGTSMAGLE